MRLASKNQTLAALDNESGVKLIPVEPEDMWHLNNLIMVTDTVRAHAVRKVVNETSTGSTTSERVHTELTITVTSVFFDPAASSLHVSGKVRSENAFVSIGQYHTLDLELHRPCTIWKRDGWDSVARQTLAEAVSDDKPEAIAAVVMHEGLANVCLITDARTVVKGRVEHSMPRKQASGSTNTNGNGSSTTPAAAAFYEKTLTTLLRTVDFARPRTLLLASPGFTAQDFRDYMRDKGQRAGDRTLQRMARDDAVVVHSSTGFVHSLNEVLQSAEVQSRVRDKRFSAEAGLMDRLHARLRQDDGRAWYGAAPVTRAVAEGAVGRGGGVLLVNNRFFRSMDVAERRRYVGLVDRVKLDGGDARILSSDHESGRRLDALGGIAAMLTYPMYDLDDEEGEGEGEEEAGEGAGQKAGVGGDDASNSP